MAVWITLPHKALIGPPARRRIAYIPATSRGNHGAFGS